MDDTFTELDKKVGQFYKKALYSWLDVKETTLPSSWCPLYSAKHVRLGRSKDECNRRSGNKVDDEIKEAFSAYFSETKYTPFGGSLQANCSVDPKCLVYYFEIKINNLKSGAVISVGFGEEWSENYKEKGRSSKLPGELWNTFGWLSNGSLLCSGEKVGSIQGYGVNDIVGIGLNFVENSIFCTKKVNNNDYFVVAYRGWQVQEFLVVPKVGFRKNAEIRANFGQDHFEYHEKLKELIEQVRGEPAAAGLLKVQPEEVTVEGQSNLLARLKRSFPYFRGETLPSQWSHRHKRYNLELSMKGLEVTCKKICPTFDCAGSVRSDVPIPSGFPFYYFEVEILESSNENSIAIGICTNKAHLGHLPGRFFYSYGYHSDGSASGPELREGKDKEQQIYRYPDWQPKFKKGDVIGCGLNLADIDVDRDRSELFFTVNGRYLGFAYYYLAEENWYPMIGMKFAGDRIRANFGQDDFAFDVLKYIKENVRTTGLSIATPKSCPEYSILKKSQDSSNKKQKAAMPKQNTLNLENKEKTTIPIAKPPIVLPYQSSSNNDSDNSCARIRPFIGKLARVKSSKVVAVQPSTATNQLHSTHKALSSKSLVPKPKKSLVPKPSPLTDPRLFSPNPEPTTPDKIEYTPNACLVDQPSTSHTTATSTNSNPLLRDPRLCSLNATRTKELFPLKPCLKKSSVQNMSSLAKRSAAPFKKISFSTTLASSVKEKTDHTTKADVSQTITATDRRSLLKNFTEWLPKKKSGDNASDSSATTTSCSSSNSSCQNSPVERDRSGQVRSPISIDGQPNDNCSQLVVQLVENGKVAEAVDKISMLMPDLLVKHQLLSYRLQLQKFLELFRDFRDGQQSNEDTKTIIKKMRLDKPDSLQSWV